MSGKNLEIAVNLGQISDLIFKCLRNKLSDEKLEQQYFETINTSSNPYKLNIT
jgi:hypothetical protein